MTSNIILDEEIVSLGIVLDGFYYKNLEDNFYKLELSYCKDDINFSELNESFYFFYDKFYRKSITLKNNQKLTFPNTVKNLSIDCMNMDTSISVFQDDKGKNYEERFYKPSKIHKDLIFQDIIDIDIINSNLTNIYIGDIDKGNCSEFLRQSYFISSILDLISNKNLNVITIPAIATKTDITAKEIFLSDLSVPKNHKEPITISTNSQYVEIHSLYAQSLNLNNIVFNFENTYELCINKFRVFKIIKNVNSFFVPNVKSLVIKSYISNPEFLILNLELESLSLMRGLRNPEKLKLNNNLKKLTIHNLEKVNKLTLNDNLEKLILPDLTNAKDLILNKNLKFLKLDSLYTSHVKTLKLNQDLEVLELNGIENGEGIVFNDKLRIVQFKSLKTTKNLILPRSIEKVIIPRVTYLPALKRNHPKAQFIILE